MASPTSYVDTGSREVDIMHLTREYLLFYAHTHIYDMLKTTPSVWLQSEWGGWPSVLIIL